jgi:hypothetical protein
MAEYNFYRAAQHGLGARVVWPEPGQSGYREQAIGDVIERMLPVAYAGLAALGISGEESSRYLGVIETRLARRRSGAIWQQQKLAQLKKNMPLEAALHQLLEEFISHSAANTPVAEWPL